MLKLTSLCLLALGVSAAFAASDLQKVIEGLPERGDGAFLRRYPNGFRIFGVGTAAIDDPNDANSLLRAEKIASMNARKALSEYISQSLSAAESASSAFKETQSTTEVEGEGAKTVTQSFGVEEFKSEVSSGTQSLMRGVVTLKTIVVEKGKLSFSKVLVGYSSKTLNALDSANGTSSGPSALPETNEGHQATAPVTPFEQKKEEWIICIGHGADRKMAIQAAIIEGIQQVYGTYLENSETYKARFAKLKQNGVTQQSESSEGSQDTTTQTKGFVDEYRIISVEPVQAGMEAKIKAKFVNPRAGGLKALMIYPMEMPLSKTTNQYNVAYKKHLTGAELGQLCSRRFERAFARTNKYIILNIDDMKAALNELEFTQKIVEVGKASPAELSKVGKMLTADYFVKTSFNDIKYSRKLGFDKKTKKMAPTERLTFSVDYQLVEVKTGETKKQATLEVILNNEMIRAIRTADDEASEEEISDRIFEAAMLEAAKKLANDAQL